MKIRVLGPLLLPALVCGCVLSPGQDLPSAGESDSTGDGPPDVPIVDGGGLTTGDGDEGLGIPTDSVEDPCGTGGIAGGGAGGEGGACPKDAVGP